MSSLGSTILNGLASAAISIGISAIIQGLSYLIDKMTLTKKEAKELSDQFNNTFSSNTRDQAKTIKTLSEIEDEYEKLSKGVNSLGENVSLTEEEFERYNQITQTIADTMPELIQGYNDQGDAIINLKSNVESLTEAYRKNQETAAQTLYEQTDDKGKYTVINGVFSKAQEDIAPIQLTHNTSTLMDHDVYVDIQEQIEARKKLAQANQKELENIYHNGSLYEKQLLSEYVRTDKDITDNFNKIHGQLQKDSTEFTTLLEGDARRVSEAGLTYLRAYQHYYTDLTSDQQRYVDAVMNSLDFDYIQEHGLFDQDAMEDYAVSVINTIKNISSEDLASLNLAVNLSTEWNNSEISYDEYVQKVQALDNLLQELFPNDENIQKSIKILYDIPDIEDLEKQQDVFVNRLNEKIVKENKGSLLDKSAIVNEINEELKELEEGGGVKLTLRPEINPKDLEDAGWNKKNGYDVSGDYSTVYTRTYSDEAGERWINFTPIIVDPETGEYIGVMSPDALQTYAERVIAGVQTDDLNLQIGAEFDSEEAAENAAIKVHNLHEKLHAVNNSTASMGGMPSDVRQKLKEQNTEIADEWYNTLTNSERKFVDNLSDEDLAEAVKFDSTKEFDEWLAKLQAEANDKAIEIRTNVGASENLNNMKDAFDDLTTAYLASVKNQDSSGNATNNIASADLLHNVNDAFGGITEIKTDTDVADINALSNALEAYNTTLLENKGDSQAAQEAADQLATAYVDQSDVLDNLTEANKEYYIQQLKENGVANAEKVVNSRLSKQYQKTREALENLSKSVAKNRKALDAGVDAGDEFEKAITDIKSDVQDLLAVYDDSGVKIKNLTPELDETFIKENLEDIKAATEGDIDALDRLRLAVARINAAKAYIDIDLPADVVSAQLDNLMDKVAQVDAMDIEVGASVDDTAFIGSLQNMINSGQTTADAVSAAFESMGYNVEFTHKTATVELVKYVEEHGANGMPSYVPQKMKEQLSVPEMKITRVSKSSGAKVSNYNGGSSSSSGGSGGSGGSDSGSGDSSEETFDWVEVAITRLEEELDRLNEKADDVYDSWKNRNAALQKEIEKTTEEITAQEKAAEIYAKKAEEVNWGTTDEATKNAYIDKIKKGEIKDVNSIEEIKNNETLTEAINEYKDYWEKSIAASDTATTLGITVKEYYKTLFENIESEYDEFLTNIEKKTDIIDERITRMEEHGYFVDEEYYNELKKLEQQNRDKLDAELKALVEQFNKSVADGKLTKESEAWQEEYQSILDVNKALEESDTNLVKIDNDIRQLQWDKFDWLEERMSDVAEEADFLIKVLQGEVNFDEQGNFNNRGFAQASLIGAKYDDAIARAKRYQEAIREIDEQMQTEGGKADKNLIERKESLVDAYRDAIEAAEYEKSAMQSLVKEGIQLQLDSLKELIDEYKNSLSAAKDLYTYQKNIADQTKNIANLEKQLRALENDNSEESRKRKLELQNQLDDAQQSLEETQWDRYISETGTMLDNMYSDYEEFLDDKTKEITALMNDMIEYINKNASNVEKGLSEIKTEYGFTTQHFEDFTSDQKALLNIFKDGNFSSKFSTITENISNILKTLERYTDANQNSSREIAEEKSVEIAVDGKTGKVTIVDTEFNANSVAKRAAEEAAKKNGNDNKDDKKTEPEFKSEISNLVEGNFGTWRSDDKGWWFEESDGSYPKNEYRRIDGEMYWFDDHGYAIADDGKWKWDEKGSWFENEDGWYPKDEWVWIDGVQYYFDEDGYVTNKRNYKGYAKGTRSVPSTDLYWTNEKGTEGIFKTDSGAILTPLNAGDMVFNHQQMEWLFDASKAAISGANKISPKIPGRSFGNFNATNNLTVVLPNVESYDDFKRQMKADRNVQQWMQEVTIGQMMGNNKLNSKKY